MGTYDWGGKEGLWQLLVAKAICGLCLWRFKIKPRPTNNTEERHLRVLPMAKENGWYSSHKGKHKGVECPVGLCFSVGDVRESGLIARQPIGAVSKQRPPLPCGGRE